MPKLSVGVIVMRDTATVLLVKEPSGPDANQWALPGGLVNDQEPIRQAAVRIVKEISGLETEAKQSLFVCETVQPEDHRVALFCLSVPTSKEFPFSLPTPHNANSFTVEGYTDVRWTDVRELGRIQQDDGMSEFSASAFVKFSEYLKMQSATSVATAVPSSGAIN